MTSIIKADNISTVSGSGSITIPTGVKVVGTDSGSIVAPGHVLQVSHTNLTGNSPISTSTQHPTTVNVGSAVSFTPKLANSKLLVTVSGNMKMTSGAQGCFVGVKRDGTYVDFGASQDAAMFIYMASTTVNHHQSSSSTVMIDASSTNATSFQVVYCRYGGSGQAEVGNWHGVHLTIQEIAQ